MGVSVLPPPRRSRKPAIADRGAAVPEIRPLGVYDAKQAGAILRVSARRVGWFVRAGELRASRGDHGKLLILGADLIRFLKARSKESRNAVH